MAIAFFRYLCPLSRDVLSLLIMMFPKSPQACQLPRCFDYFEGSEGRESEEYSSFQLTLLSAVAALAAPTDSTGV